eukprot:CAMPEP_0197674902 /NCGR_PEP_ID=MMETSP1338-20131121/83891_1 /TAXON_ID=43686 ORGANISM="Pelagodinium beii, Strain RCC1491" /NCGR_SAMPLE_ID=MMETSP1338 /ASSEMBLY_ACC=CAM_ASM_000754 /LENGTH=51 /DNA_ID=CAMNT_0043255377 /DNA_START=144 /DNA_END=296 /DNA_ORIENTATION=-
MESSTEPVSMSEVLCAQPAWAWPASPEEISLSRSTSLARKARQSSSASALL